MRRTALLLFCLALGAFCALAGCSSGATVPPQDNTALVESRGVEAPAIRRAAAEVDAGEPEQAFQRLVDWFQAGDTRSSPARDVALFVAANALIEDDRRLRAFFYLDELLDLHRSSDLYYDAAQRQYEIADSYLRGEHDRTLFLRQSSPSDAIEMLFRIQTRVPGSELAERALLRTADYYFDDEQFDFAEDAYTVFIERFPRSPSVPRVRLQQAWSNLLQYDGPRYDPTPLLDARQQFQTIATAYPDLAEQQQLAEVTNYIDAQFAKKQAIHAGFYDRTGEEAAAEKIRRDLVQAYPNTPAGQEAAEAVTVTEPADPTTQPAMQPNPEPAEAQP